jgi:hypothetical protein
MKLLFISFLFNGDYQKMAVWLLVAAILAIIPNIASLIDLRTGINASKRLGVFKTTSYGLRQTISKDRDYLMYFFLLFLIDCCLSFFIDYPILCIVCAIAETIIEVISIRENVNKGRSGNNHDPIELMQSIATAYGDEKAKKIFDIIKDQTNESKSDSNQ